MGQAKRKCYQHSLHVMEIKASVQTCPGLRAIEFIERFDIGFSICHSLLPMYEKKPDLSIYINSRSLNGLCIYSAKTTKRHLQFDLSIFQEA